jgi:hypothetical protein
VYVLRGAITPLAAAPLRRSCVRVAHLRVPNLLASDQTSANSLPQCLTNKVALDRSGLNHIKNGPQGASELKALRRLYIALGQVGVM